MCNVQYDSVQKEHLSLSREIRKYFTEEIKHEPSFDRSLGVFQVDRGGKNVSGTKGKIYPKHNSIFVN